MRKVRIGFSYRKGFAPGSWAIRAYEQTKYSHVYFATTTKWKTDLIYQASGTMVNFMAGAVFYNLNGVYREFEFDVSDNAYDNFMCWATTTCGKPYASKQLFGYPLMDLFDLKKNPLGDGDYAWVCAELVLKGMHDYLGIEINVKDFETASLVDLYRIVASVHLNTHGSI